jgi:hypothetical protein
MNDGLWFLCMSAMCAVLGVAAEGYADDIVLNPVPEQLCIVEDARINEASGIACSLQTPDAIWMHNDSGDEARLFLVQPDGKTRAVLNVPSEKPLDWEDMCSFSIRGKPWLLVADIGDNAKNRGPSAAGGKREPCRLLLIPEPEIESSSTEKNFSAKIYGSIEFTFEDGARDCESVAVDVERQEILLVSKSRSLDAGLYRIPLKLRAGRTVARAERLCTLSVLMATSMDISPDHRRMVVVSPFSGVVIERTADESWADACRRPGQVITLPPRKQGETVCFQQSRNVILVNSEFAGQPLWRLQLATQAASGDR